VSLSHLNVSRANAKTELFGAENSVLGFNNSRGNLTRNVADKKALSAQGCYVDKRTTRDLPVQVLVGMRAMTIEACISACSAALYRFAAVQVY